MIPLSGKASLKTSSYLVWKYNEFPVPHGSSLSQVLEKEGPQQIPFCTLKCRTHHSLWSDCDSLSTASPGNSSQNATVHSITYYRLQFTEHFNDLPSLPLILRATLMTHLRWRLSLNLKQSCKLALLSISMYLKQEQQLLLATPNLWYVISWIILTMLLDYMQ